MIKQHSWGFAVHISQLDHEIEMQEITIANVLF